MIRELRVENLAIVSNAELTFETGFTVITGETGAGKSLFIEALQLLAGKQASDDYIKYGQAFALIEGTFYVPLDAQSESLKELLGGEESIIIYKKIVRGKSAMTRLNSQTITLKQLKTIMAEILLITSQHDTHLLFDTAEQLILLDRANTAKITPKKEAYKEIYTSLISVSEALEKIKSAQAHKEQRIDFLDFQINELLTAELREGEEDELHQQKKQLRNQQLFKDSLLAIDSQLKQSAQLLKQSLQSTSKLSDLDSGYKEAEETLHTMELETETLRDTFKSKLLSLEGLGTISLDTIETRLDQLFKLKSKYRVQHSDALLNTLEALQKERESLESAAETFDQLLEQKRKLETEATQAAKILTKLRKETAQQLQEAITTHLRELGFSQSRFEVEFSDRDFSPSGTDTLQFLISPNPGEPLKPLHKIASGGELSRLMLAFQSVLSGNSHLCMIFDEIDTGIGGLTANHIGTKLKALSQTRQVLCITHLPQIARLADTHFKVEKSTTESSTSVTIHSLSETEHTEELHRMVGGELVQQALNK